MATNRSQFATRLGVIATTAGSAVGLGNIWRFPFEAGQHGGSAFIILYVLFSLIIGIPLMCSEFMMGRGTRSGVCGAYRILAPRSKWYLAGYLGVLGAILIPGFYAVVAGWTLEYFGQSVTGALDLPSSQEYHLHFLSFATHPWRPILWMTIFLVINFIILIRGAKGIEKVCNILMPILFIILLIFCTNSLTMSGASEGLQFLFKPDWSKVDSSTLLAALGQSFFSLSLGIGCLTTYGSYFSNSTPLARSAVSAAGFDTMVAVLAAVIIFPAVFTFGNSVSAGPTLVFEVLPEIFNHLPAGVIWSALFFFLLFVASLTSTLSMHEIVIAFLTEEWGMSRRKATVINCMIVFALATISSLSFGPLSNMTFSGLTFFGCLDYVTSNIIMPLGGLLLSIFVGWKVSRSFVERQLSNNGTLHTRICGVLKFSLRFLAPAAITLIFLNSIGLI